MAENTPINQKTQQYKIGKMNRSESEEMRTQPLTQKNIKQFNIRVTVVQRRRKGDRKLEE